MKTYEAEARARKRERVERDIAAPVCRGRKEEVGAMRPAVVEKKRKKEKINLA